ncbi:MAG: hypothetical protein AABY52_03800 [Deltaproteobacteria bacterium]
MNTANIFPAMMGAFGLLFLLLFFILVLIWIVLPFAVFGIKDLLREAIEEQKKTNELLKDLLKAGEGFKHVNTDRIEEEKDKSL